MLKLHFLNVGKGSCTIIEFPGRLTVVDIDDSQCFSDEEAEAVVEGIGKVRGIQEHLLLRYGVCKAFDGPDEARQLVEEAYKSTGRRLTDPISYLNTNFGSANVYRFTLTHPHMDHLSGLARLYHEGGIASFWDTKNTAEVSDDAWENSLYRKEDWECYQRLRRSQESPSVLYLYRDCTGRHWTDDGIEIWSPTPALVDAANRSGEHNNLSYVLRICYRGTVIVLGGDAKKEVWSDILACYGRKKLKCDVLLAPHHGSKSAYQPEAVDAMSPRHIVVSVAAGTKYAYDEYSRYGEVLSTKWRGNIVFTVDAAGNISRTTQYHA